MPSVLVSKFDIYIDLSLAALVFQVSFDLTNSLHALENRIAQLVVNANYMSNCDNTENSV